MPQRFSAGDTVYGKDGRSYVVEAVDGDTVYCTASNGAETEFPQDTLFTVAEWAASESHAKHGKREISYQRLKQSRHFAAGAAKATPAAEQMMAKITRISPSLIDFTAFNTAARFLAENREDALIDQLSIIKSRAAFDEAPLAVRVRLLAELLGAQPDALISAAGLGDNLLKAMIDKGMAMHEAAFEDFQDRPRK